MKTYFQKALLPAMISSAIMLSGCGSSSDSTDNMSSVSGTTLTSGIITGFGSIYVNGIKFETNNSHFNIDDDNTADQDDLRVGMRVEINGTINDDGLTGTADSVNYDNELEGPVSAIDTASDAPDIVLTILGQLVTVNADTTFDNDDNNLDMNSIQVNDLLEVSGYTGSNGIIATHIEKQEGSFDSSNPDVSKIEMKGEITELETDSFMVNGFTISYTSATELEDVPNDTLVNGLLVEVKGSLNDTADTLIASKIEAEDDGLGEDVDEVEIEGLITLYDDTAQTFVIQNQLVDVSNVSEIMPSTLMFENDLKVEVEGTILDGTLLAEKIKLKGRKIKIHAAVSAISTENETVTFSLFGGTDNVTVRVNQQTDMEDDLAETEAVFTLADLAIQDFVEVEAFDDGTDVINAVELERKERGDVQLEGPVTAFDASAQTITMFGKVFTLPAEARYEAEEGDEFTLIADFFAQLSTGSFVELTDEAPDGDDLPDGIIDKVEIEEEDDD